MTNDQTVTQALEPCPFCGGVARIETTRRQHPPSHWVECAECEALSGAYASKASAVAAWNTRTAHSGEGRSNGAGEDAVSVHRITRAAAELYMLDIPTLEHFGLISDAALSAPQGEVERLRAENERLTRAVGSGMLNDLLTPDESDEFVKFIQFLRGQRNAALAQPEAEAK